ncbi:ABC transporter ATPase [Otariodibacter sp.]|uniref:ABC transporter ATPase n=1 Tax=Otariodibacter sp. TaxID=3030919 RepID=UPI002625538D|nr:ABC transporter ATPase [Otariodibacter sp.]
MRKLLHNPLGLLIILFIAGCTSHLAEFSLPKEIKFQDKTFQQVTNNKLDEMQQSLYLESHSAKDPDNWQEGFLLFLDKNSDGKTLQDRLTLRQNIFQQQDKTIASLKIEQGELRSQIIYPPTERFNDIQLEVSRGQNSQCGYSQMQFSNKRSVTGNNLQNLAMYQTELISLAEQLSVMPWIIECK